MRQLFLELEMNRMGGEGHSFRSGMAEGVRRLRGLPREASDPARGSGRGVPPGGGCTAGGGGWPASGGRVDAPTRLRAGRRDIGAEGVPASGEAGTGQERVRRDKGLYRKIRLISSPVLFR